MSETEKTEMATESKKPEVAEAAAVAAVAETPATAKVAETSAVAEAAAGAKSAEGGEAPAKVSKRRQLSGVVVCDKADKTVRVRTNRSVRHPLYEKIIRRRGSVQAHDADNVCRTGDSVIVEEAPRTSKTKSWRVVERRGEAI